MMIHTVDVFNMETETLCLLSSVNLSNTVLPSDRASFIVKRCNVCCKNVVLSL